MDFTYFDPNDCSMLIKATKTSNITLVQESIDKLVELGKDVTHELHTPDRQGFTAIHHAAQLQLLDVLNLLLEYADYRAVNQLSFDNRTALTVSVDGVMPNTEGKILRALLEKGANPNLPEKDPFILPLLSVLEGKHWKCAQVLLQFGADPMKCDGCHTVLPIYFALANLDTLRLLVSKCPSENFCERVCLYEYLFDSRSYPITTDRIDVHEVVKIIIEHDKKCPNSCREYYSLALSAISLSNLLLFRYLLSETALNRILYNSTISYTWRRGASTLFVDELVVHLLRFISNKSEFIEEACYFFIVFKGSVEQLEKHQKTVEEAGCDFKELEIDFSKLCSSNKFEKMYNLLSARLYMGDFTETSLYLSRKLMAMGQRVSPNAYYEATKAFLRIKNPSQSQKDFTQEIFMSFVKDRDMRSEHCNCLAVEMFAQNNPFIKGLLQHGVPIDRNFFTLRRTLVSCALADVDHHMKLFMERFIVERPHSYHEIMNSFTTPEDYCDTMNRTFVNPAQTNSTVWSLKHHCRISIRNSFGGVNLYDKIDSLAQLIPPEVISYLKFEREELEPQ